MTSKAVEVKGKDQNNYQYKWVLIGNPAKIRSVVKTFRNMLNGDIPEEQPRHINQDKETWEFNKEQAESDKLRIQNLGDFIEVERDIELYTLVSKPEVIQ